MFSVAPRDHICDSLIADNIATLGGNRGSPTKAIVALGYWISGEYHYSGHALSMTPSTPREPRWNRGCGHCFLDRAHATVRKIKLALLRNAEISAHRARVSGAGKSHELPTHGWARRCWVYDLHHQGVVDDLDLLGRRLGMGCERNDQGCNNNRQEQAHGCLPTPPTLSSVDPDGSCGQSPFY